MKKALSILFIFVSITGVYAQKKIAGTWEGKLSIGQASLRLVFHFEQNGGQYSGTMDSPDQGAYGIPCDRVTLNNDTVIARIMKINGGFKGILLNDSTMSGNWEQGGKGIAMTLNKSRVVPKARKPAPSLSTRNIAGIWEGKLYVGDLYIRLDFHFDKQSDNSYSGTMDSPDQGTMGVPCNYVILMGDSLTVEVKTAIIYKDMLVNDSSINGVWNQGGKTFPVVMKKVKQVSKAPLRPQTPKPPFNYNSEDIEYDNADKTVHFGATFTYPKGKGPFPTAIMITGSGQQDRDETILGHKPFAVIADYLTKKGIAVLRVDDRGMGKSTGDISHSTSADFANDAETGLNYLKGRKEADQKRMGLIGHREGGLIASIVAARNSDIDFVIMLAGPGVKGSDILLKQTEDIMLADSVPAHAVTAYGVVFKKLLEDFMAEKDSISTYSMIMIDFKRWKASQTVSTLNTLKIGLDSSDDKKLVFDFMKGFASP